MEKIYFPLLYCVETTTRLQQAFDVKTPVFLWDTLAPAGGVHVDANFFEVCIVCYILDGCLGDCRRALFIWGKWGYLPLAVL